MTDLSRVEELTLKLLDDAIDEAGREELERLIEADPGARDRFLSLVSQEAALRGLRQEVDLVDATLARIRSLQEKRIEEGVLDRIRKERAATTTTAKPAEPPQPAEPGFRWLWSRRFFAWSGAAMALVLVAVGLHAWWLTSREAEPQEARLYGQEAVTPGLPAAQRVFVRDGKTAAPLANADVRLAVYSPDGDEVLSHEARTDEHGFALFEPKLAADAREGEYTLKVEAASGKGSSVIERKLTVRRSFKVMVSTDKPLYQPGQVIHIRTLSLASVDMRPVAGRDVVIEVRDAKGNKVFKKKMQTSAYGIAAADFQLADQVNTGEYAVAAVVGDTTSERSVNVKRYRLPKYRVDLTTDRGYYQPGKKVAGQIRAGYTFGEPVAGARVRVEAQEFIHAWKTFAEATGRTGPDGVFRFEIPLKEVFAGADVRKGDATVSLVATVVDTADHQQKKTRELVVTTEPIRVELFPESGKLVQNVENVLYVLTAYPDGRPARTSLTLGKTSERIETSSAGIARVKITPKKPELQLTIAAEDAAGARVRVTRKLRVEERADAFLLRTDRAVYQAGDTARVSVHAPAGSGVVFVDAVKERRTMLTRSLTLSDGSAELELDLPPELFGTLELHAYRILRNGEMAGDTRVIQVNRADDLVISAELDKSTYRPAERALLRLAVTRGDGSAAPSALGLSGVDEAVFALSEMRPGLERVYFALQEEILKPRYEIHAHLPVVASQVVDPARTSTPELEEATVVLFSGAEAQSPPKQGASETFHAKNQGYREAARRHHASLLGAAAVAPVGLFLLLTLSLIGYAFWRLAHRAPVDAEPEELKALGRSVRWTAVWWVAMFYLPLGGMFLTEAVLSYRYRYEGAILTGVLLAVLAIVFLSVHVLRFRAQRLSRAVPLLRKLLSGLPFAAVLGLGGIVTMVLASKTWPRALDDDTMVAILLVALAAAALAVGALSAGSAAALRRLTAGGWWGRFLSRTALAASPALVPFLLLFTMVGGRAPMADIAFAAKGGFAEQREMASLVGGSGAGGGTGEKGELKAPTRVRRHFPETLLWQPELITDDSGKAELVIPLADSITTWRIAMSAVSARGELGAHTLPLRVFQDFFVDVDFPVALTQHDRVSVPVAVYNYLDRPQTVRLDVERAPWFSLQGPASQTLQVAPKQVTAVSFTLTAMRPGTHALTVRAHGSEMADAVERTVRVEPDGKAVVEVISGRLDENKRHEMVIPKEAIAGADDLLVKIYPGSFSQVVEGLDSILRMPSGCFEQTSSATYPNVLVLDYLRSTGQVKPEIEMKALQYINTGYQRLLSYEVSGGGFEWFGKSPAHVVLTAYGLMEFTDMARVYDVDPDVIARTREWLFSKQNGNGAWEPTKVGIAEGAINQYQGQVLRTTCYVAWAMAESAPKSGPEEALGRALNYAAKHVDAEDDAYTLAVCANALVAGDHQDASRVLKKLDGLKQVEDKLVHWTSKGEGATHSRGDVLDIETTAIAAYAYLEAKRDISTAHKALAWLTGKKDQFGNWSSTQATIHSFRALLLGAGPGGEVEGELKVTVTANGKVAKDLVITPDTADVFHLISLRDLIRRGKNLVALEAAGEGNLAYQVVATHFLPWSKEQRVDAKPMTIDVAYDTTTLKKNDELQARVTVTYNRPGVAAMTIVDLGIPPGFEALPGTFEALKEHGVIERYSVTGRQVILYIREIPAEKPLSFVYQLRAKFPVRAKAPSAKVYQYYEPEVRDATEPVKLTVL